MAYKLFLDDYRQPIDCIQYMYKRIGKNNPIYLEKDWQVVINFEQFRNCIIHKGLPTFVSFDHDLADEHYVDADIWEGQATNDGFVEKTGYDCCKWLVGYCAEKNLKFPDYAVHSMNMVGKDNIENYIDNYLKSIENTHISEAEKIM